MVTATLQISELAARTGFTPSALRYYEQVGLIPATDRTPAGYRRYDERDVARLRLIERAKQLGLPLADIRELVSIWDDGLCTHVRGRLRGLVTRQSDDVRGRIAELAAVEGQLAAAYSALTEPGPGGPCAPGCGCAEPSVEQPTPVLCTLDPADVDQRAQEWHAVMARARSRQEIGNGVRVFFPPDADLTTRLAGLAVLEQTCCGFFDFTIRVTDGAVAFDVHGPAQAQDVIHQMFGPATPADG